MKRRSDLGKAFWLAVAIHVVMGIYADNLLAMKSSGMVPAFKTGESSVLLTLVPARENEPERTEPLKESVPEEAVLIEEPDEPEEEIVEEVLDDNDADLLKKGVEGSYSGNVDIRPRYPLGARLRGEEGSVTIGADINSSGRAENVLVLQSSGFRSLDRAAVYAVERVSFVASGRKSTVGGKFVQVFRFTLLDQ
jgi:TonB family protein